MKHKVNFMETKHVPPLSNRNEIRVLHELIRFCHRKLSDYPRTFQGDMDMLELKDLTTNHRNALHVTLAEQTSLISLIEEIKKVSDMLFITKKEFQKIHRNPDEIMQELMQVID